MLLKLLMFKQETQNRAVKTVFNSLISYPTFELISPALSYRIGFGFRQPPAALHPQEIGDR